MKALLKNGDFKSYTEHLATLAGLFIAMAEDIETELLTDEEKNSLVMRDYWGKRWDGNED